MKVPAPHIGVGGGNLEFCLSVQISFVLHAFHFTEVGKRQPMGLKGSEGQRPSGPCPTIWVVGGGNLEFYLFVHICYVLPGVSFYSSGQLLDRRIQIRTKGYGGPKGPCPPNRVGTG